MKHAALVVRLLLGLMFTIFGLNMFLNFIPQPKEMPPKEAMDFAGAMMNSGYMKAVGAFQLVGGLLLLIGRYVPVGLTLLGPVIVNIIFFHYFLAPTGIAMGLVVAAMEIFLIWSYRAAFAGIFQARTPVPQRVGDVPV